MVGFVLRKSSLVPPSENKSLLNKNLANRILAVSDYLSKVSERSRGVATKLDEAIAKVSVSNWLDIA